MKEGKITLFFWPTPNCYKVSILLEELKVPYDIYPVHIGKGEQFASDFLELSPHGKVPAITDSLDTKRQISVFESGAILLYLAEKYNQFLETPTTAKLDVIQWLMFQMGNAGPMLGQAHHFRHYAKETVEYAINRYTNEASKVYAVLDTQLSKSQYLAGADYSIADIAVYPWLRPQKLQGQDISKHPIIQRWYNTIRKRPAVQRGLSVMNEKIDKSGQKPEGDAWQTLFGGPGATNIPKKQKANKP